MLINNIHGTSDAWCVIQNYPGEVPVFDYSGVVPSAPRNSPTALSIFNSTYLKVKGLRFTGYNQIADGSGVSRGIELYNCQHMILENNTVDHFQGTGFFISSGSTTDIEFLNCDSHHNEDPLSADGSGVPGSDAYDNADGFGVTGSGNNATAITFTGCRAWLNCDDGWDNIFTDGVRTWVNCWAFLNGYRQRVGDANPIASGNGNGFKIGSTGTNALGVSNQRVFKNCIAFDNRANGFDQNGTPTTGMTLYNCTAFRNSGYGYQFQYYPVSAGTVAHLIKNCAALSNGSGYGNLASAIAGGVTNNSWQGGITINSSDFASLDTTGVSGARQADGSLPNLTFLHLASGSDLINAGTPVGIIYDGANPDLGAYEYTTGSTTILPTANAGIDQVLNLPTSTTTLSGSGTGVASLSYLWTALDGGTLSSTTVTNPTVTGLTTGGTKYKFVLKVTDGNAAVARDTVEITVVATGGSIVPTGVIIRSVTYNSRLRTTNVQWDADVTTNSQSFNVQRKANLRGASFSNVGAPVAATLGEKSYKVSYNIPVGYQTRICPVDKQGTSVCSAAVTVKKN